MDCKTGAYPRSALSYDLEIAQLKEEIAKLQADSTANGHIDTRSSKRRHLGLKMWGKISAKRQQRYARLSNTDDAEDAAELCDDAVGNQDDALVEADPDLERVEDPVEALREGGPLDAEEAVCKRARQHDHGRCQDVGVGTQSANEREHVAKWRYRPGRREPGGDLRSQERRGLYPRGDAR